MRLLCAGCGEMGAKQFDYYIFIDYSENLIGYNIIECKKIKEVLTKITRFRHYREARNKRLYLKNVKNTFKRERLLSYFLKNKIRDIKDNMEIFLEVGEFIKTHANCLIFVSIDDKQYSNFEKFVEFVDGKNIKVMKESQLKENSPEYKVSLVLDNWLNIERLKNENK